MIPASERAKTVHALDRLATVTGASFIIGIKFDRFSTFTVPFILINNAAAPSLVL
jgi:hypothetical protein